MATGTGADTSVVIVTYNHARFIEKCLRSVLLNNPKEIMIIDNKSVDNTVDLVKKRFPEVKLVCLETNMGFGAANNIALGKVTGKYFVTLNPDTYVDQEWLESLTMPLSQRAKIFAVPRILLYDGSAINTDGNIEHITGLAFTNNIQDDLNSRQAMQINGVSGACFAIRTDDISLLGGFDEKLFCYMEDAEISWRALVKGFAIAFVPESIVYHDYAMRVNAWKLLQLEKGRYHILRKYLSVREYLLLLPSLAATEALTWGFSLRLGKKGIVAKSQAIIQGLEGSKRKSNAIERPC